MGSSILAVQDLKSFTFDFEDFIKNELGLGLNNDNKNKDAGVCKFYLKGNCAKGSNCQFKHSRGEKAVVCKHWLRGLCKKGDQCEFLHEYNLKKMPECWFYSKFNECSNGDECIYLHIDPESKIKECPWYARGFCKHGPNCRHKHVRMVACQLYLSGFCPQGPNCPNGHPKYELPTQNKEQVEAQSTDAAHSTNPDSEEPQQFQQQGNYRPREEVTCFKCGQKGHYANRCPIPRI